MTAERLSRCLFRDIVLALKAAEFIKCWKDEIYSIQKHIVAWLTMYPSHEYATESQQNTVNHKINTHLFPLQHVLTFYMVILRETCSDNINIKY